MINEFKNKIRPKSLSSKNKKDLSVGENNNEEDKKKKELEENFSVGETSKNNKESEGGGIEENDKEEKEFENESTPFDQKITKYLNEGFTREDFPHFYLPDSPQNDQSKINENEKLKGKEEELDTLQKLYKYSKNFKQLMDCIKFINIEKNKNELILSINKIKENDGEAMLKMFNLEDILIFWKKLEKGIYDFKIINKQEDNEKEVNLNKHLNNLKNVVKKGYFHYIYMLEFCKKIDKIYEEEEYKKYLEQFCEDFVNLNIEPIKNIINEKNKKNIEKFKINEKKNKEEIKIKEKKNKKKVRFEEIDITESMVNEILKDGSVEAEITKSKKQKGRRTNGNKIER